MSDEAAPALTGRRILIVEDEFLLADDLALALAEAGATIAGPVATAAEALDLIARGGIDAAVVDLNLRDHFALDVADALLAADVPFCLATAYDEDSLPARLRGLPRCAKPITMRTVIAMLERLRPARVGARA